MSNILTKPGMKRTAISASLGLLFAIGSAQAVEVNITTMKFYDANGNPQFNGGGLNTSVVTTVNFGSTSGGTAGRANSGGTNFFGTPWTAEQVMWDETTGVTTTWSGSSASGAYSYTYTLSTGQVAVGISFTWGSSSEIMVLQIFDCSDNISCTGVSSDSGHSTNHTNVPGTYMANGPFSGQHATFSGAVPANFDISLSGAQGGKNLVVATTTGGTVTITPTITGASGSTTYNWGASDAALLAVDTGTSGSTYQFNPTTLTSGTTYTVSLTATVSGSGSVVKTMPVTVTSTTLTATDTDGDGLNDNDSAEGFVDNDGDGIPNYLDPTNDSAAVVAVDAADSSKGNMSASSGTLRVGATAFSKNKSSIVSGGSALGMLVTMSDIGTTDTAVSSTCAGGCFDFEVRGLSNGASTQVVIPLSAALPDYPVYRKFTPATSSWQNFLYDDDNYLSSAAALSTDPITCPSAGSSSYTRGLTPGDFCLQLTMTDGGPNDADGYANGVLMDPGGIASSSEEIMVADVPNGCSMSTTPVNPTERADWWLVAGFLGALAWLRGMRRKGHAA